MKIEIYINDKPMADYSPQELEKIKETLTERAFKAAGYTRMKKGAENDDILLQNLCNSKTKGQKEKAVI